MSSNNDSVSNADSSNNPAPADRSWNCCGEETCVDYHADNSLDGRVTESGSPLAGLESTLSGGCNINICMNSGGDEANAQDKTLSQEFHDIVIADESISGKDNINAAATTGVVKNTSGDNVATVARVSHSSAGSDDSDDDDKSTTCTAQEPDSSTHIAIDKTHAEAQPQQQQQQRLLVATQFKEGPLGVSLRRRATDGIVFINELVANSQAVDLDVAVGDELWAIGADKFGEKKLDKEAWVLLIQRIRDSPRPLEITWMRPLKDTATTITNTTAVSNTAATSAADAASVESSLPSPPSQQEQERDAGGTSQSMTTKETASTVATTTTATTTAATTSTPAMQQQQQQQQQLQQQQQQQQQQVPVNARYEQLKKFVSRLVPREKDNVLNAFVGKQRSNSSNSISSFQQQLDCTGYHSLIAPGRMILKIGELEQRTAVSISTPLLWLQKASSSSSSSGGNKRTVALFNDMIVIAIAQSNSQLLQVEFVIDLQTCKLRSLGQVFGGSNATTGVAAVTSGTAAATVEISDAQKHASQVSFQVLWPGGTLDFSADSKEEKEVWVLNIFLAICSRVEQDSGRVLGWRHQYMLGTMHAAVLSRDEARVRELVAMCEEGQMDFHSLDCQDEDGYTPLHYACMLRMTNMVRALHEATADVTAADFNGWTPLHWAAMQLDDYSLNLLCSHIFDLDLEDKQQRTPLYMACVEGRDIRGLTEPLILSRCLSSMLLHHPNVNLVDWKGFSLLHYLCASWQHEPAELLIKEGASVHTVYVPMSVGPTAAMATTTIAAAVDASKSGQQRCRGMNALHFAAAALPLKAAVGLGRSTLRGGGGNSSNSSSSNSSDNNSSSGSNNTATDPQQQQQFQPEPLNKPHGIDTLRLLLKAGARPNSKDSKGRTALVIIAEAYLADIASSTTTAETAATAVVSMRWNAAEVVDALSLLISFGARWDENSPQLSLLKQQLPQLNVAALWDKWSSLPAVNGDDLNIGLNHFEATNNVTGSPLIDTAAATASAKTTGAAAAGGAASSTGDNCLLCSFKFTLFKRQHHCRICYAICCDECSKKRCIIEGSQVRCCDSCFNQLVTQQERDIQQRMIDNMKPLPKLTNAYVNSAEYQKEKEERQQQERSKLLAESNSSSSSSAAEGGVDKTLQSLREARQRLEERGKQLEQIDDRSQQLADQSSEFARMARQLNEQQKNRWF